MSLTAHILFERPTTLPAGTRRRHMMEDVQRRDPEAERPTTNKNAETSARNTEAVYKAVADGCDTHSKIEARVGLSQSTVKKALYRLEGWPGGPRISRDRRESAHRFEIVE